MREWIIRKLIGTRPVLANLNLEPETERTIRIQFASGSSPLIVNATYQSNPLDRLVKRRLSVREYYL